MGWYDMTRMGWEGLVGWGWEGTALFLKGPPGLPGKPALSSRAARTVVHLRLSSARLLLMAASVSESSALVA